MTSMYNDPEAEKQINEILIEIKEKIFDEKFVQKYGTSVEMNMGHDYTEVLRKNFNKLIKEFKIIDKDNNDVIDKQELSNFLNKLGKEQKRKGENEYEIRQYNKNNIDELFEILDLNSDMKIST